jgi:hypothetical protein
MKSIMLLTSKPLPPIVGLYAKWGSGKSFLLRRLRRELEAFTRGCWALGLYSLAGGSGLPYRKVSTRQICGGRGGGKEAFTTCRGCWTLGLYSLAGGSGLPYRKVSTRQICGFVGGGEEGRRSSLWLWWWGERPSFEDAGLWDGFLYGKVLVP